MSKHIEPIDKRIVLKRLVEDKVGRIIIPEASKEKKGVGTVISIASNCEWVKKDDVVAFALFDGQEIELDREKFVVIEEANIFGKIIEGDKDENNS